VDLRTFGSQGETRSVAIALKLAQGELVFRRRRIRPILFFDDIFSELDQERARRLQDLSSQLHQVLIHRPGEDVSRLAAGRTPAGSVRPEGSPEAP
jgi:recombinational DNA repair ATPase RecF